MHDLKTKLTHYVKERLFRRRDLSLLGNGSVPDFWDRAHEGSAHLWLTGTDPQQAISRLGVYDALVDLGDDKTNTRILDVGVGEGRMAKYLKRTDVKHDVLDVSAKAVQNVSKFSIDGYTSATELSDDKYGLIMHHLVSQHMSHIDLQDQITEFSRSLRSGGILALQYAATSDLSLFVDDNDETQKVGAVTRNPDWFAVAAVNASLLVMSDVETDAFGEVRWRVVSMIKP